MAANDPSTYEVRGWKAQESFTIAVTFAQDTWIRVLENDVATDNPASTTYHANDVMEITRHGVPGFKNYDSLWYRQKQHDYDQRRGGDAGRRDRGENQRSEDQLYSERRISYEFT